jgi:hypothetical protein
MCNLENRIVELERQLAQMRNRESRAKRFRGSLLVLAAASLGLTAFKAADNVVRADRFEVVRGGKVCAAFSGDEKGGGWLHIFDSQGRVSAQLAEATDGGFLELKTSEGKKIVAIGSELDDHAIRVYNDAEKVVAAMTPFVGSGGAIRIYSDAGLGAVTLAANSNGGALYLYNKNEKTASALASDSASGFLKLYNTASKPVAALQSNADGGQLRINSKLGTSMIGLVSTPEGGSLGVQNKDGKAVAGIWTDPAGGSMRLSTPAGGLRFKAP